jgi:hypothetical protein
MKEINKRNKQTKRKAKDGTKRHERGTRKKVIKDTLDGENNGNTKKLRNIIYVCYTEKASFGNTEDSYISLHSLLLMPLH